MKLSDYFISKNDKIINAIKKMELIKHKIVLVVDKKNHLIGTVTDGDIRRGIIMGTSIQDSIYKVANKNPVVIKKETDRDEIKLLMKSKSVYQIPQLDNRKKIVKIHFDHEELKVKKENTVLILAGGYGKRLMPLTKRIPKPMIKIAGKPIIEHLINKLSQQGFVNIIIAVHYLKEKIKKYLKNGKKFGVKIKYINEKNPLGTAGAIKLLKLKKKLPVVICNSDVVSNLNFSDLLTFHKQNKSVATLVVKQINQKNSYGVINTSGLKIKNFVEKPNIKLNINAGVYVLEKKVLNLINKDKFDMPELYKKIISKKLKTIVYPIYEDWTDVGSKKNLSEIKKRY